jgi:hypothetical protein
MGRVTAVQLLHTYLMFIGTLAATFQSCMYGAFTPAGGVFAKLTAMAMTGARSPMTFAIALILATVVAITVWACGVGR